MIVGKSIVFGASRTAGPTGAPGLTLAFTAGTSQRRRITSGLPRGTLAPAAGFYGLRRRARRGGSGMRGRIGSNPWPRRLTPSVAAIALALLVLGSSLPAAADGGGGGGGGTGDGGGGGGPGGGDAAVPAKAEDPDYTAAVRAIKAKDFGGAIRLLDGVVARDGANADAYNWLAYATRRNGDPA